MSFQQFKKASYISPGKFLYSRQLSGSILFKDTDCRDLFEQNLEQKPANWHYRTKIVEYQNNSMGYRAPEFDTVDWTNSAVIFGCSCVYGIGLAEDETISHHLENIWGIPVINMGVGGSSVPFAFYNQISLAELGVLPKVVINAWTSPDRHTFFNSSNPLYAIRNVSAWSTEPRPQSLYNAWNASFENSATHSDFLVRAARLMWKETAYIDCTLFHQDDSIPLLPVPVDRARDDMHPGPLSMLNAAKYIAQQVTP